VRKASELQKFEHPRLRDAKSSKQIGKHRENRRDALKASYS